jgi:hypothetical protein
MSAERTWYAGRLVRRGARAPVEVLASVGEHGWEPVPQARRLFPRLGQVELQGPDAAFGSPGDWLTFQVMQDGRPGARIARIGQHRMLFRLADLRALGSIEAVRQLLTREGWTGAVTPGHWIVRFSDDRCVTVHLERSRDRALRCTERSLLKVACLAYRDDRAFTVPVEDAHPLLYDPADDEPLAVHDWSPGADYVARIVKALAGADDPRLPELIAWLELHRDEVTGRVSATGVDAELAYEALRSGELAARLSADREVMAAYLEAVRDDPSVREVVASAVAREAEGVRHAVRAEMERELDEELRTRRADVESEAEALGARLREDQERELRERRAQAEADLGRTLAEASATAAAQQAEAWAAAEAALAEARAELEAVRGSLAEEQARVEALRVEAAGLERSAADAADRLRTTREEARRAGERDASTRGPIWSIAGSGTSVRIDREDLFRRISGCVLLTPAGRELLIDAVVGMLAGEIPVLHGPEAEALALVAEAHLASGRLVPFDADATTITPDDIWSRPGSGLPTQVAQAAALAAAGETALVHLRGIDRSAAHLWHPALTAMSRRGMLPRLLLMFATLGDPPSAEGPALPEGTLRLKVQGALVGPAALVAPNLLGGGSQAIACSLDCGERPVDLSGALPVLQVIEDEDGRVDVPMALRIARIVVEARSLGGFDDAGLASVAQRFVGNTREEKTMNGREGQNA